MLGLLQNCKETIMASDILKCVHSLYKTIHLGSHCSWCSIIALMLGNTVHFESMICFEDVYTSVTIDHEASLVE